MNAIILAGGKGSRMKNISKKPKVLLEINGKPILQHAIDYLNSLNVQKIFITVANESTELDKWIIDKPMLTIVKDEVSVKGNSFGIVEVMKMSKVTTILAYGDTIFDFDVTEMLHEHRKSANDITVLIRDTNHPEDSDLAWYEEGTLRFSKYPHKFDTYKGKYGVSAFYILSPDIYDTVNTDILGDWFTVLQYLSGIYKIGAYELKSGYIYDLGTPERYLNFKKESQ